MEKWYYVYPFPVRSRSVNDGGGQATSKRYTLNNRYPWELRQPYTINYTTKELLFKDTQSYYNEHKINLNDKWKLWQLINHVMRLLNYRVSQLFEFSNAAIKSHSLYGDTTSNVYNYYTGIAESHSYLGNRFRYPDPMPNPAAAYYVYYPEDYMTSYDVQIADNFIDNNFVIKTLMDTYKEINGLYTGRYNETDNLRIWRRFVSKDNTQEQWVDEKYKYYDDLFKTYEYDIEKLDDSILNFSKGSIWDAWTACFAQLYYCQYYYIRTESKPASGWRMSGVYFKREKKDIYWDKGNPRNIIVDVYNHHPLLSYPDSSGSTVWWTDYYNGGNGVVGKRWRENPFTDPWDENAFWLYDKRTISWVDVSGATNLSHNYDLFDGVLSNYTWNGWYAQFEMYWSFASFRTSYNLAMGYEAIPPFYVPEMNYYFLNGCSMTPNGISTSSTFTSYRGGGIYTYGPNSVRNVTVEAQSYENPVIVPDTYDIFYPIYYNENNMRITPDIKIPSNTVWQFRTNDANFVTINNDFVHNGLPTENIHGQGCVDECITKFIFETYGPSPPPTTKFPYDIHIKLNNGDYCVINGREYHNDTVIPKDTIVLGSRNGNEVNIRLIRNVLPNDHVPEFTTTSETTYEAGDILVVKHHFTDQVEDLGRKINQVTFDASDMHWEHIPETTFKFSRGAFKNNKLKSAVFFNTSIF